MTERLIKRGETSGRIDDNQETIKKRLETFHEQTTPILGYYGKQGKLITIDAHRKPDDVFTDVTQALERLMEQHQVGKQLECFLVFLFASDLFDCLHTKWTGIKEQQHFLSIILCFQTHSDQDSSSKGIHVVVILVTFVYPPVTRVWREENSNSSSTPCLCTGLCEENVGIAERKRPTRILVTQTENPNLLVTIDFFSFPLYSAWRLNLS